MGKTIKVRQVHRDIRALDKTVTGLERVKRASVRTKAQAEQARPADRSGGDPVDYAEKKVISGADIAAYETARQVRKQSGRAVDALKEKYGIVREETAARNTGNTESGPPASVSFSAVAGDRDRPKEQMRKNAQKQAEVRAGQRYRMQAGSGIPAGTSGPGNQAVPSSGRMNRAVKTAGHTGKGIKTSETAERAMSADGNGKIKNASRTVKTAERGAGRWSRSSRTAMDAVRVPVLGEDGRRLAAFSRKTSGQAEAAARKAERALHAGVRAASEAAGSLLSAAAAGGGVTLLLLIVLILFGGVLCMVGGGNSDTVLPVSAEVEAYEPLIRQYADEYGIPEYTELVKAVMMQESGGRGTDPMQCSESGFNTRYPREVNGITDPAYSIQCGVRTLKNCLTEAGVENPVDMAHIRLALQGYNYGNGYITWALRHYGGYSAANAAEFSDMMAQRMRWPSYGDKQYASHVLRYYVFGRVPAGAGNQAIVQVALSQEGNVGGQPYWSWYGFNSQVEWCACFVSWCADRCGYIDAGILPRFASCSAGVAWFTERGRFMDGSYVPAAGDIIFFDWYGRGPGHVGIVESTEDGVVHTIEGNSGNACRRNSYPVGGSMIYGYGCLCP